MKKLITLSLFILSTLLFASCSNNKAYEYGPIYAFDTVVTIVFYEDNCEGHYKNIKNKINEISRDTNDFSSNSSNNSVYDLNIKRELEVSDTLVELINKSISIVNDTNGYFNPFMGRLTHKWKDAISNKEVLSKDIIDSELAIINSTSVEISGNKVKIVGDGNIDLGGIVKGYALEWMRNYLKDNNITKYYVDCGSSSIYIGDYKTSVAFSNPYGANYIKVLSLDNMGVATSNGKHQNMVVDGVRYHHLINPKTGYPSNNFDTISVIGKIDNTYLDAYSTALFSMSEADAINFCKNKNLDLLTYSGGTVNYHTNVTE